MNMTISGIMLEIDRLDTILEYIDEDASIIRSLDNLHSCLSAMLVMEG